MDVYRDSVEEWRSLSIDKYCSDVDTCKCFRYFLNQNHGKKPPAKS